MSLELDHLNDLLDQNGPLCRVLVLDARGSTPREPGAAMLVWADGQDGTIGGGALEFQAAEAARTHLAAARQPTKEINPLGPSLGQCCGGSVTVLFVIITRDTCLNTPDTPGVFMRPIASTAPVTAPIALIAGARAGLEHPTEISGWLAEAHACAKIPVWIYGGGHVGRAVGATLARLPGYDLTLIDTMAAKLPDPVPDGVTPVVATDLPLLARHAPASAHHLIMTYSHAVDLRLCHALLGQPCASIGLIGSETKWARFQRRLTALGHSIFDLNRITCPIGEPGLGKHPEQIAIGVAHWLMQAADTQRRPLQEFAS